MFRLVTIKEKLSHFYDHCRDAPTQGRLQVGPFLISPAFAMIIPGGSSTVSVECISESDSPKKFEEVTRSPLSFEL